MRLNFVAYLLLNAVGSRFRVWIRLVLVSDWLLVTHEHVFIILSVVNVPMKDDNVPIKMHHTKWLKHYNIITTCSTEQTTNNTIATSSISNSLPADLLSQLLSDIFKNHLFTRKLV